MFSCYSQFEENLLHIAARVGNADLVGVLASTLSKVHEHVVDKPDKVSVVLLTAPHLQKQIKNGFVCGPGQFN